MITEKPINVNENILVDNRRKNWFWDYNDVFSSDLTPYAKLVRLYLARCANQDRQSWPSYNKIAKDCGISRDTAKRAVAELEEKGWVRKTLQKKEGGEYLNNIYLLCDPPEKEVQLEGGGCSQHPPCHDLEGVGADSTHLGAHSTYVGAETAPNNTNITIHNKNNNNKQTNNQPSIHHDDDNNARAREEKTKPPVDNVDIVEKSDSRENVGQASAIDGAAEMTRVKSLLKDAGFEGSQVEIEFMRRWINIFPPAMIEYALRKSVLNGKKNLYYVEGILDSWLEKGVRTIEEARRESRYDTFGLRQQTGILPEGEKKRGQKRVIKLGNSQLFKNYLDHHGG